MRSIKTPAGDTVASNAQRREWIIQRCTQVWVGTELRYEDWPGYAEHLTTRAEMLTALQERVGTHANRVGGFFGVAVA